MAKLGGTAPPSRGRDAEPSLSSSPTTASPAVQKAKLENSPTGSTGEASSASGATTAPLPSTGADQVLFRDLDHKVGLMSLGHGREHQFYMSEWNPLSNVMASDPREALLQIDCGDHGMNMENSNLTPTDTRYFKAMGAFKLPPRPVQQQLVTDFFRYVFPNVPCLNRHQFLRAFDSGDAASGIPHTLLLAVLCAGSRVSKHPAVMRPDRSPSDVVRQLYKRVKTLVALEYEKDPLTLVQTMLILSTFIEMPHDNMNNSWYWLGQATRLAQSIGIHRQNVSSRLSAVDQGVRRRIWWTLVSRDRACSSAMGRPLMLNLEDSDVEPLSPTDFVESEGGIGSPGVSSHALDSVEYAFFISMLSLSHIMARVVHQQYVPQVNRPANVQNELLFADVALAGWLHALPEPMRYEQVTAWEKDPHAAYFASYLHLVYYTTLCMLHRPFISRTIMVNGQLMCPSKHISLVAADMLTSIFHQMRTHDVLRTMPNFALYSLLLAMMFHFMEFRSESASISRHAQKQHAECMLACEEFSPYSLSAKVTMKIFELVSKDRGFAKRFAQALDNKDGRKRKNSKDNGGRDSEAIPVYNLSSRHNSAFEQKRASSVKNEDLSYDPSMASNGFAFTTNAASEPPPAGPSASTMSVGMEGVDMESDLAARQMNLFPEMPSNNGQFDQQVISQWQDIFKGVNLFAAGELLIQQENVSPTEVGPDRVGSGQTQVSSSSAAPAAGIYGKATAATALLPGSNEWSQLPQELFSADRVAQADMHISPNSAGSSGQSVEYGEIPNNLNPQDWYDYIVKDAL